MHFLYLMKKGPYFHKLGPLLLPKVFVTLGKGLTRYLVGENKKSLSLHHGKFNVRIFGKLHAAFEYTIPFYSSKSRK